MRKSYLYRGIPPRTKINKAIKITNLIAINIESSDVILNIERHCINGLIKLIYKVSNNLRVVKVSINNKNCKLSIKLLVNRLGFIYHEKNSENRSNMSKLNRAI